MPFYFCSIFYWKNNLPFFSYGGILKLKRFIEKQAKNNFDVFINLTTNILQTF